MEVSESKKLTTKDMARAESDKGDFEHSNQNPRPVVKDSADIGMPTHLDRVNGEALSPLLSANEGKTSARAGRTSKPVLSTSHAGPSNRPMNW